MRKTKISHEIVDPHQEREAQKYDNPIPSREFIIQFLRDCKGPRRFNHIAAELNLQGEEECEALRRRLGAMERDGQIVRNRREGYGVLDKMDMLRGRVIGHPEGFGFLVPDTGGDDVFLSVRHMNSLLHGDRAVVQVTGKDRRGRLEGSVVEVLERANHQVVGRYFEEEGVGFVVPDNSRIAQDILIAPEPKEAKKGGKKGHKKGDRKHGHGARHGMIVVVEIINQPDKRRQPMGRIVEVMGEHMAPGMEIDVAIRAHGLPLEWPEEVQAQIAGISAEVSEKDKQGREDLRELPLVTIDGEDARDFDDAVYCERTQQGWRLLVAIADVSNYVKPGSALDIEAENRGNSVYFPDRVIPMLPEILSNGLCSLNPHVDRLCMVCEMQLDEDANVISSRFMSAVMCSSARLTYTQMAAMVVDNDKALRAKHAKVVAHLDDLYSLYQLFRKRREARGAIDFDTTETRIVFGQERKIDSIVPVIRNDAHKLIEEFMVAANVETARHLEKHKMPTLYRIHEPPGAEKLQDLREFLAGLALSLGGGDKPQPRDFEKLINATREREDAHLIQTVLLRSMRMAVYSPENVGHFGLAFDAYAHFTSPIRRYPDLLVHRALKHLIAGKAAGSFAYSKDQMTVFGEHCSMTDRRADEATRDAVSWLKCEYMLDKIGDEFSGVISAVTGFGIFVELEEIFVEGLVHVTSLGHDYYRFDPTKHQMVGERSGNVYRLGGSVRVTVMRVDLDEKKIDFKIAESAPVKKTRKKKK